MRIATILLATALLPLPAVTQQQLDTQTVWKEFLQWYKASPASSPEVDYRAKLLKDGVPEAEVTRRSVLLSRLSSERTEALEIWFNHVFTREKPSFRTEPNALLMETVKDLKPGRARDGGEKGIEDRSRSFRVANLRLRQGAVGLNRALLRFRTCLGPRFCSSLAGIAQEGWVGRVRALLER